MNNSTQEIGKAIRQSTAERKVRDAGQMLYILGTRSVKEYAENAGCSLDEARRNESALRETFEMYKANGVIPQNIPLLEFSRGWRGPINRSHGTRSTYTRTGCRCELCTKANSDYNKARYDAKKINGYAELARRIARIDAKDLDVIAKTGKLPPSMMPQLSAAEKPMEFLEVEPCERAIAFDPQVRGVVWRVNASGALAPIAVTTAQDAADNFRGFFCTLPEARIRIQGVVEE